MARKNGSAGSSAAFANVLAGIRAARAYGWYRPPADPSVFLFAAEYARLDAARTDFFSHDAKSLSVFDWAIRRRAAASFAPNPFARLPFDLGGEPFTRERWAALEAEAEALEHHAPYDELEDRLCCWLLESYRLRGLCEVALGDVVLDCGAFTGNTAMYFAEKTGVDGRVFAFEPSPENYELLRKCAKKLPSVTPDPRAVAEYPGLTKISSGGGTGAYIAETGDDIKAVSIDVFARERRLERVDFIKMDIEGFEVDALRGAADTIRRFSPKMALSAYHRPLDPADLPTVIAGINPDYAFYLRHFTDKQFETVLFCVPRRAEKRRRFFAASPAAAKLSESDVAEFISRLGAIGGAAFTPPSTPKQEVDQDVGADEAEDFLSPEPSGEKPFLSVVIPAYKAERTLPKTLSSMKAALSSIPHEIIVVDDCSPDKTNETVLKLAKDYNSLRLLRLARNVGVSKARMCGANVARGEWLWFFDADDYVPKDAFKGFDYKEACAGQDVLIFTYKTRPHRDSPDLPIMRFDAEVFGGRPKDAFTLAEYPSIITASYAPWNKWFRADLAAKGATFGAAPPGDDLLFSLTAMLRAGGLRFVDRAVCVYCEYNSSISRWRDARFMRVFEVYRTCAEEVAAFERPGLATAWQILKLNNLTWFLQNVRQELAPSVREYLDDSLAALDYAEVTRVLSSPLTMSFVKNRLAERHGIDPRALPKMAGAFKRLGGE